jgi:hypothetical protein
MMPTLARARWRPFVLALAALTAAGIALVTASSAAPQRWRRSFGVSSTSPWLYDGRFIFCRLAFEQSPDGDGGGWFVDYPRADLNFPFRLGELTETPISHDDRGQPNHVVLTATDPHLFECPFVMMTEPGGAWFSDDDAAALRKYLDKGGFLWVDDFWGEYAWAVWERELRKILPSGEFPIYDVPLDHLIFRTQYHLQAIPQIPSINFWLGSGFQTSERYGDSAVPHVRAVNNARGDIMVLMTHNTDFGDAFEREGEDRRYFDTFATVGYAFGVNVYLYAMTH